MEIANEAKIPCQSVPQPHSFIRALDTRCRKRKAQSPIKPNVALVFAVLAALGLIATRLMSAQP
jgi:hypothetical protein